MAGWFYGQLIITLLYAPLLCAKIATRLTELQVQRLAYQASLETGVEMDLLVSIARVESNFNVRAIGASHGEVGLMQLRPEFFPNVSFAPLDNMMMAAKYLRSLKYTCRDRGPKWYTCYNTGFRTTINGDVWTIYLIDDEDNVIADAGSGAETEFCKRQITVREDFVSIDVVRHELWHAYMGYTYLSDTGIDSHGAEEVAASLFADRAEVILAKATEVLAGLVAIRDQK